MVNLSNDKCCGCAVCAAVCPKNAIVMKADEYGYIYPKVNLDLCVDCNLCDKVCPSLHDLETNTPKSVLATVSKDRIIHETSASGGFAAVLSEYVISENGVVYGCAEISCIEYRHIRVENYENLELLKGSKYVQSDAQSAYSQVQNDLKSGRIVLFTGTPCQVAGLYSFLRKPYDNLITLDLVCHGVPPVKMLKEQIESYKELKNIPLNKIHVDFRWKVRSESRNEIHFGLRSAVRSEDGHVKIIREENDIVNPYMRCFQTGVSLRESCLNCKYTKQERVSDFTAADFWGLGRQIPSKMHDKCGVSLVLVNSSKAMSLFEKIGHKFDLEERTFEEAKIYNRCLSSPFEHTPQRDEFLKEYKQSGLIKAAKKTDRVHLLETSFIVRFIRRHKKLNVILSKGLSVLRIWLKK
jgi:coenzyme F420-reducing hydrogenase beta subunit